MHDAQGVVIKEVAERIGNAHNHFASYQAVMRSLQIAKEMFGEQTIKIQFELKLDNELVKKQLNSESPINEPGLVPHFIEIHNMSVESFPHLTFTYIPNEQHVEAARLVSEALEV